ncbi:hypothetical protein NMY22_g14787 [Coprinellus aureogranulatus]|nr:hypothetical protein NMY22_g14787 [Coprinellus aureogranulatus]
MTGWSPVYPSAYFRSSAYPQPASPATEEALRVMSQSQPPPRLDELRKESQESSSSASGVISSETSSFTKGIIPFPDGRPTPSPQPALASSSSVLPQPQSQLPPRNESSASTYSTSTQNGGLPTRGNIERSSSTRDSSGSFVIPSPSAFPAPPSSIPKVQYPYRPLAVGSNSGKGSGRNPPSSLRTLPSVTTAFSQPSASSTSSRQPSAGLSSGVTYTTGQSTGGSSPAMSPSGNPFSPSSVGTLPAYSPLRDPPPFSALSPPSESVLSSLWSGRPALSPLFESKESSPVSTVSGSSRQALLTPLSTSNLPRPSQGQLGSSTRSPISQSSGSQLPSPASVLIASKADMTQVVGTSARRTPGGSLPVNASPPENPRVVGLKRGGSVSTVRSANGTLSRQPSTIDEEYYGIAR